MAFTLRLDDDTAEAVRRRADTEHLSAHQVVERAVRHYLANTAPDEDVAALLPGIAGQVAAAGAAADARRGRSAS